MRYKNTIHHLQQAIYRNNLKTIQDRSKKMRDLCEEFEDSIFEIHYQLWLYEKIEADKWFTGVFKYSPHNPNNPLND